MDAVVTQYTVGVGAKRSTHIVYLANMGDGNCCDIGQDVKMTHFLE